MARTGISVIIEGRALELQAGQQVELILNSPFPLGGDPDVVPGSYSLPFDVPLTPTNRELLGWPNVIDSAQQLPAGVPVTVGVGSQRRQARLGVQRATARVAQCYVVVAGLEGMKDMRLRDLDLGGALTLTPEIALTAAQRFHDRDTPSPGWVMFPTYGAPRAIRPGRVGQEYSVVNAFSNVFESRFAASPFVRVDYLLRRIVESAGYSMANAWQVSEELRGLVLVSNRLTFDQPADGKPISWPETVTLTEFLPDITCAEMLKAVTRNFNLCVVVDDVTRRITLLPAARVGLSDVVDWSPYAAEGYDLANDLQRPRSIAYPPAEGRFELTDKVDAEIATRHALDDSDLRAHYVLATAEQVVYHTASFNSRTAGRYGRIRTPYHYRPAVLIDAAQEQAVELPLPAAFDWTDHHSHPLPRVVITGDYVHPTFTVDAAPPEPGQPQEHEEVEGSDEVRVAFAFFRGFRHNRDLYQEPFGTVLNTNADDTKVLAFGQPARHSLEIAGAAGVVAQWHAPWWRHMARRRIVKRRLVLPNEEFDRFRLDVRIQIGNQLYLAKTLQVGAAGGNRLVVDAELVASF